MKKEYQELYHQELAGITPCSEEEIEQLLRRLPAKEARDRLTEGSLHLAVSTAEEFEGRGADLFELIQEGNIGLALFMNSLRGPVGLKEFITLRKKALRASMEAYCREQEERAEKKDQYTAYVNVLNTVITALAEELGREPTAEEIAKKMNLSVDEVQSLAQSALNAVMLDREAAADSYNSNDDEEY